MKGGGPMKLIAAVAYAALFVLIVELGIVVTKLPGTFATMIPTTYAAGCQQLSQPLTVHLEQTWPLDVRIIK